MAWTLNEKSETERHDSPPPMYPSFSLTICPIFSISSEEYEVASQDLCILAINPRAGCLSLETSCLFLPLVFTLWRLLRLSPSPRPDICPPLRIDLLLFPPVIQLPPRSCDLSTFLLQHLLVRCAVLISSYMSAAANAQLHPSIFGPNTFLFFLRILEEQDGVWGADGWGGWRGRALHKRP